MNEELVMKLINEAKDIASRNFCCSHSNYTVGASLLTTEGQIYNGFNIENDGIQSICAERVAFSKALSEGNKKFSCIAVVGKKIDSNLFTKTLPCGYCRQFICEYTDKNFLIYTYDDNENKIYEYKLSELLPENFSFKEEKNER